MKPYLLDTNAFWEVLNAWNKAEISILLPHNLLKDGKYTFVVPEISLAEIYSVLGKYARIEASQILICGRRLNNDTTCTNTWTKAQPIGRVNKGDVQRLKILIQSIITKNHHNFDVVVCPITTEIIHHSAFLLQKYAVKYDFHSLDATVAATADLGNYTVVTGDKPLLNVLKLMEIDCFKVAPMAQID